MVDLGSGCVVTIVDVSLRNTWAPPTPAHSTTCSEAPSYPVVLAPPAHRPVAAYSPPLAPSALSTSLMHPEPSTATAKLFRSVLMFSASSADDPSASQRSLG